MLRLIRGGDDFRRRLVDLNPWLSDLSDRLPAGRTLRGSPLKAELAKVRNAATKQRIASGPGAWNAWARQMLDLRRDRSHDSWQDELWQACATTADMSLDDVSGMTFPGDFDAAGLTYRYFSAAAAEFHGDVLFGRAVFQRAGDLQNARIRGTLDFSSAVFHDRLELRQIAVGGGAKLDRARFQKDVWFTEADLSGPVTAREAEFHSDAGFGKVRFRGAADFTHCQFLDNAGFEQSTFEQMADFADALFCRNTWFRGATFAGSVRFDRARFRGNASFENITLKEQTSQAREMLSEIERSLKAGRG